MAFDFDIDLGEIIGTVVTQAVTIGGAVVKDQLVKPPQAAPAGPKLGVEPAVVAQAQTPAPQKPGQAIEAGGYGMGSMLLGAGIVVGAIAAAFFGYRAATAK